MKYEAFDDYFWAGQNCMKNLLDIHNQIELDDVVNKMAMAGLYDLQMTSVPEKFNARFLKSVHKTLFGQVYDWAGEYRVCPMARNTTYADPHEISDKIDMFCQSFEREFLEKEFEQVSDMGWELAKQWGVLNKIHPFRDGNGRSQFGFFHAACRAKGCILEPQMRDMKSLRQARDAASEGRSELLGGILTRSLKMSPELVERDKMLLGKGDVGRFMNISDGVSIDARKTLKNLTDALFENGEDKDLNIEL